MPKIKIIPDYVDAAKPKHVPKNDELSKTVPRFRAPGGKPPLQLEKSYNRQGKH
jgi:hypothetical protein